MSKLSYRTIADERPQGKPNVYFSCHPEDFGRYFEEYATKILKIQSCAIWYEAEPEADYDKDDLELNLSQMQLFVMPVTTKLLTESCRAMDVELPLAKEKHIPVLPLMMEQGLDQVFSRHFGDLQYLDPNNKDETKRKFDEVLETYESLHGSLEDEYHPDIYRLAFFKGPLDFDVKFDRFGECDIEFEAMPQRFLMSGEQAVTLTKTGTIANPTAFAAKPLLRVYGEGTLTISGVHLQISKGTEYIDIDCDLMDAFEGTNNRNSNITLTDGLFPVLMPGNNRITLGSGITKVVVTPRWWRL